MAVAKHNASRPAVSQPWYEVEFSDGTVFKYNRTTAAAYSKELLVSQGNPGPPYRSGGAFLTVRREVIERQTKATGRSSGAYKRWNGYYVVNTPSQMPLPPVDNLSETIGAGGTGWNRYRPDGPGAELGTMLAEMRKLNLPHAVPQIRDGLDQIRRGAGGHLAVQFGLLPMVADLRKIYALTKGVNNRLHQLRRDNGLRVKRGGTVANISNTTTQTANNIPLLGFSAPIYSHPSYGLGQRVTTTITFDKYWFEGAFRYYVAKPDSWLWNVKAVAALYGAVPSASMLWELTPWSWLFDWWTNTGSILGNLSMSAADSLVAEYAYAMGNRGLNVIAEGVSLVSPTMSSLTAVPLSATTRIDSELKRRTGASPYGFGLKPGDLSVRQMSILAALGMSRKW